MRRADGFVRAAAAALLTLLVASSPSLALAEAPVAGAGQEPEAAVAPDGGGRVPDAGAGAAGIAPCAQASASDRDTSSEGLPDAGGPAEADGEAVLLFDRRGWSLYGSTWYYADDSGSWATGWRLIGGAWYYFDASGAMATGLTRVGGDWYLMSSSGAMMSGGWVAYGSSWYYANPGGDLRRGWLYQGGAWYWLDPETCAMATGLLADGGSYYYLDPARGGAMAADGWVAGPNGVTWLADSDGRLVAEYRGGVLYRGVGSTQKVLGSAVLGGRTYQTDPATGTLLFGWHRLDLDGRGERYYYFDPATAAAQSGWVNDGTGWYLLDSAGGQLMGWQAEGGSWYYLDPSQGGRMLTGWVSVGGTWYLLASSGAMRTGWVLSGDTWYYLDPSGAMATGVRTVNGVSHDFGTDGGLRLPTTAASRAVASEALRMNSYGWGGGWCQAWVASVYARAGQPFASLECAHLCWDTWGVSTERGAIPVGATVYTRSTVGAHGWGDDGVYYPDYGHVGIYVGNGTVVSLKSHGVVAEALDSWTQWDGWFGWGWNGGVPLA